MRQVEPRWLVQGNHDLAVGVGADPQCSPAYRLLAAATQQFSERVLTAEMKQFLAELVSLRHFEAGGAKWAACHAVPSQPRFHHVLDATVPGFWPSEVEAAGRPDFLFVGHTHPQMNVQIARTLVVNPGSVGQPKDGDPRAAYAVWHDGDVSLRRTGYSVADTARAFSGLSLAPEVLHTLCEVLRTGGRLP
jgi:diadenosine tetraphosphatase ApaH/serine/threonine PP2A family protein phosphatase